ncbi:MAG: gamma-glutamyltransferase [Fidelibacterota bacterium]
MSNKYFIITIWLLFSNQVFSATPNPVFAKNGMVVSTSRQASEAGVEILKKGGNAIDAAVAVGFALSVTSPSNGNVGGGGFMVAHKANGDDFTLDYREKAPSNAHRNMYLDDSGNIIKDMSLHTRAASGVPGSVEGLLRVWEDHGSGNISMRELLAPAIALAEKGFKLSHFEATRFNHFKNFFLKNDAAAKVFIRNDGQPWKADDIFKQKDLAQTLKRISRNGKKGFYMGKTADLIVAEMERGNGFITYEDLLNYTSKYREPVRGDFLEYDILSMGPPSSGGAVLIEMLNMLELAQLDSLGWNSSEYIHLLTEVERIAYADRAEHMGDSDFWDVPLDMLLSENYATRRFSDISMEKAAKSSDVFPGNPSGYESKETTQYSVIDKDGNAVSVTTTINLSFGSGILVEGAGFFLNNEMDDFSSKPGTPNFYGLVGKEANAIAPGKRPLSSMTPTIVLKNGNPFMVTGSPGGSTIITTTLQTILNVTVHGMNIQEAVSVPRTHSQWLPDVLFFEKRGLPQDVIQNLERKGHLVKMHPWKYLGKANAIVVTDDWITGGADTRGENTAVGY